MAYGRGVGPLCGSRGETIHVRFLASADMPHFLLTYGDARRLVGVVIMEAPSMFHARMNSVVRRFAAGVPFGDCHELSAKMMTAIPPTQVGRMMSGAEASQLIFRLVEGRRRPEKSRSHKPGDRGPAPTRAARLRRAALDPLPRSHYRGGL